MSSIALVLPITPAVPNRDIPLSVTVPEGQGDRGGRSVLVVVVNVQQGGAITQLARRSFSPGDDAPLIIPANPNVAGPAMSMLNRISSPSARSLAVVVIPGVDESFEPDLGALLEGGYGLSARGPFPRGFTLTLPEGASFRVGGGLQGAHCLHESEIAGSIELERASKTPGVTRFALIGQALSNAPDTHQLFWEAVVTRGPMAVVGSPNWRTVDNDDVLVLDVDALADAKGAPGAEDVYVYLAREILELRVTPLPLGGSVTLKAPKLGTTLEVRGTQTGPEVTAVRREGGPKVIDVTFRGGGERDYRILDFDTLRPAIEALAEETDKEKKEGDRSGLPGYRSGSVQPDFEPNAPWALILAAEEKDDLLTRLAPLIAHRETHLEVLDPLIFPHLSPEDDVERATREWIEDNQAALTKATYLLIAGSVPSLPFTLEARLGPRFHLGRLGFDDPDHYDAYAKKVVALEVAHPRPPVFPRFIGVAPDRPGVAHQSSHGIYSPIEARIRREGLGESLSHTADAALWSDVLGELVASDADKEPALFAFFGHGAGPSRDDQPRWNVDVGAPLDQAEHPLESATLRARGMLNRGVAFLFACYGGAHRAQEELSLEGGRRLGQDASAQISALPQALLLHPEGPVGVIAHLDPLWELGLRDSRGRPAFGKDHPTVDAVRQTLTSVLQHRPIGVAVLYLRALGASAREDLGSYAKQILQGSDARMDAELQEDLATLWVRQVDGLNWLALGDPRVALGGSAGRGVSKGFRS